MGIFLGSSPVKFSGISKAFLGNSQIYSSGYTWNFTNATPITADGTSVEVTPNDGYTFDAWTCENQPEGGFIMINTSVTPHIVSMKDEMTRQPYAYSFNVTVHPTPIE